MPAFNTAYTLRAAVQSLQRQTLGDWEVVVVDDGSTDGTPLVLRELEREDRRIRVTTQANQRQAAARNTGIARAQGDYIAFLDADDLALPERLEKQVGFLRQNAEISVLGGGRIDIDAVTGAELCNHFHPETHEALCAKIFTHCPFTTSTVMTRRNFFEQRCFDPSMPPCEDHDLWLRSYRDHDVRFHNLHEPLVRYQRRRYMRWRHYWQMHRMYLRALKTERRWPKDMWYALRPLVAAARFNPFDRCA